MRNGLLLLLLLTVDGVWHNNDIIVRRTICTLTILISHPFHPQGGGAGGSSIIQMTSYIVIYGERY